MEAQNPRKGRLNGALRPKILVKVGLKKLGGPKIRVKVGLKELGGPKILVKVGFKELEGQESW